MNKLIDKTLTFTCIFGGSFLALVGFSAIIVASIN